MFPHELEHFANRVMEVWLPTYCSVRGYDTSGFRAASVLLVEPIDARDCINAIDLGIVVDNKDGKYRAPRSSAQEVLFWEGAKKQTPRPVWLWQEPVITFAALARLHATYGWPIESLGAQPKGWAFDAVAYREKNASPEILCEVKKSGKELKRLRDDLLALALDPSSTNVLSNSRKKWLAIVASRPRVVWLLGPGGLEHVLVPDYTAATFSFQEGNNTALYYLGPHGA